MAAIHLQSPSGLRRWSEYDHKYQPLLRSNPASLLLIRTHIFTSTHSKQTTSSFTASKPPNHQHAFHSDFHPQGADQPRRLLRCHVNDLRSLPNGARVDRRKALLSRHPATPSDNLPSHRFRADLLSTCPPTRREASSPARCPARPSPLAAACSHRQPSPSSSTPRSNLPVAVVATAARPAQWPTAP